MELLNIKNYVKERKKSLKKYSKGASITIFQVRGNPASERYVRNKIKDMDVVELQKSPWIPVTERLPKCEEEVYIQTKNGTMTTAVYEYGTMPNEKSIWNWNDIDFDYDEETDTYLVSKGWWEYRHYNPDDVYNNKVDEEVIAWMPLPEPYAESVKK